MRGTSGNVSDVLEANSLLHGQETDAFGDAGYQGVDKRPDARQTVRWHVAMKRSKRQALDKDNVLAQEPWWHGQKGFVQTIPSALAEAAGAQESGDDRALRKKSIRRTRKAAALTACLT